MTGVYAHVAEAVPASYLTKGDAIERMPVTAAWLTLLVGKDHAEVPTVCVLNGGQLLGLAESQHANVFDKSGSISSGNASSQMDWSSLNAF